MNRNIRKLGAVIIGLYLILFVKLNWIQVVQKQSLDTNPLNTAQVRRDYNRPRGAISSADGALLAQSLANPDPNSEFDRIRVYPEGDLFGQITGYFSFTFGSSAVERQYNDELAGTTFDQQVSGFSDLFVARENVGNISVTVRKDVQQAARDALGDRAGSVVALDPRSGDLLAFWSWPSYDPNAISTLDSKAANENWRQLNSAPGNPLRSHQFQDRYFPGSTFKVVTGGIGLHAADLIHEASNAVSTGQRVQDIKFCVHSHPTLSEVLDELFKGAHVDAGAPKAKAAPALAKAAA